MKIKILGTGCKKCKALEANVKEAVKELGLSANIEKLEDIRDIMVYGIMSTPALVIDEEVISQGKLLEIKEIKKIIG